MPNRLDNLESFNDFGFSRVAIPASQQLNYVYDQSIDGSASRYYSLTDILSGGSNTISMNIATGTSAELSLDYTDPQSLAYLSSVYSIVADSINNIKSNYPNGFAIVSAYTGTSSIIFNNSDTYWYGGSAGSILDYTSYKLAELSGTAIVQEYNIVSAVTGTAYSYLVLDSQPNGDSALDFVVYPTTDRLNQYYATLNGYELDLLLPTIDRTNYWPRDAIVNNNLVVEGSNYDSFVETELDFGLSADTTGANFLWRKLFPSGLKNLDTTDNTLQKFILTMSAMLDYIKRYQDQLAYAHTIGYSDYNHISKDLVSLLAEQWNWPIAHDLVQDDMSDYLYPTYDNYITGITFKMSRKDINFERYRRVLSNITTLYKKKGTREGLKYFTNIYGIPEALLEVNEYLQRLNEKGKYELFVSQSNIVVPTGSTKRYVTVEGNYSAYTANIRNTKFLDLVVSPAKAIEYDFYSWGTDYHPTITDVNGNSFILSGDVVSNQTDWESLLLDKLIRSDGFNRYETSYPKLAQEAQVYLSGSANKFTYDSLMPFVDFLDNNWAIMCKKLVPASSKILSLGTMWRNSLWHREKYKWSDSELQNKPLPFNESIELPHFEPAITKKSLPAADVDIHNVSASKLSHSCAIVDIQELVESVCSKLESNLDPFEVSSTKPVQLENTIYPLNNTSSVLGNIQDLDTLTYVESGSSISVNSPQLYPINGQYGTTAYTEFSTSAVAYTNDYTIAVSVSAKNLSESGYTRLSFELFRELSEADYSNITGNQYSILSVITENDQYGRYRVSSISGLQSSDSIKVISEFSQFLNDDVTITQVYRDQGEIRTEPKIGLFTLPLGSNGNSISWLDIWRSNVVSQLRTIHQNIGLSLSDLRALLVWIKNNLPEPEYRTLSDLGRISQHFSELDATAISYLSMTVFNYSLEFIYASILIVQAFITSNTLLFEEADITVINFVVQDQVKAMFIRRPYTFDWSTPVQSLIYDTNAPGEFQLPTPVEDLDSRQDNTYSVSGTIYLGGLDELNAQILHDKTEYFWRCGVETHVPTGWTIDDSSLETVSGHDLISQSYVRNTWNGIQYFGNYFTYMKTPKIPILDTYPVNSTGTSLDSASVLLKWKGVSDSDRMTVQFLMDPTGSSITPSVTQPVWASYGDIPSSAWTNSATTIDIGARGNVNDNHVYSLQTTLQPLAYYWWRIRNVRSKVTLFGYNTEAISSTEPYIFATGEFSDQVVGEGENPAIPKPPSREDEFIPRSGV